MLAGACIQFLFHWHALYPSTYCFTSLLTFGHQKFLIINSIVFYCPPCPPTDISWYNLITSVLNFLSLDMYTFSSFSINPSCSHHSSSLRTFTSALFISSTNLTTSLSFVLLFLILSRISTLSITTSDTSVALIFNYSFFTNVCSLLSLFTPTSQSNLLLNPSAFPILLPGTCFKIKSNLDK